MRVLIAPDKFKGSASADEVARAMREGVLAARPDAAVDLCPVADGGEGTVAALVAATAGRLVTCRVTGPLPEMKVDATFGILGDGATAVVEMAAASGLTLLAADERDPMATTTFGTGELLVAAAAAGATRVLLGIGGSATIDAGLGCAQACGLNVLLDGGEPTSDTEPLCGRDLPGVVAVKHGRGGRANAVKRLAITVASDVTNPLCGPDGAAAVFGPQKGASPEAVRWFNAQLRALAGRTGKADVAARPGAGAAGGLGFGMMAYFGAELRSGIELVLDAVRFRQRLAGVDLVLTGEGQLDAQTGGGKAVAGVAAACKVANVPCVAIAGSVANELRCPGLTAAFSICDRPMTLAEAMRDARRLVARAAEQVLRITSR